jgi:hypothetical protein
MEFSLDEVKAIIEDYQNLEVYKKMWEEHKKEMSKGNILEPSYLERKYLGVQNEH